MSTAGTAPWKCILFNDVDAGEFSYDDNGSINAYGSNEEVFSSTIFDNCGRDIDVVKLNDDGREWFVDIVSS